MEKLRRIVFNVVLYITIVAIIAAVLVVLIFVVMKLNVYAAEGVNTRAVCVLIDPGHGAEDGGAVSDSGAVEKDINLSVSLTLRDLLENAGFRVVMTRSGDEMAGTGDTLSEKRRDDFEKRLGMYNSDRADIVVSIHQNKFTSPSEHGAQVFYSPNDSRSETLARCIKRSFKGLLQPDNEREITKAGSNIYLLNNCENPCVLVECGFLSNPSESEMLSDPEYQRQTAFAVYCGILEYVSTGGSQRELPAAAQKVMHTIN